MATLASYDGVGFVELASSPDPSTSLFQVTQAVAVNAVISMQFNLWKTVAISVDCFSPDWYSTVILPLRQKNTAVYFRMGVRSGSSAVYTAWEKHILYGSTQDPPSPLGGAPGRVTLTTCDMLLFLQVEDKVSVRKGAISDIVTTLAQEVQLTAMVEPTTNSQYTLYQVYQSNYEFILKRLLSRAINAQGYGDYKFFITNNELRFATLDYQAGAPLLIDYTGRLGSVFVSGLHFTDGVWKQFISGSTGTAAVIGDPYTSGMVSVTSSTPDNSISFASSSIVPQPAAQFQQLMSRHRGANPESEIADQAQNVYAEARNKQYDAVFSIKQNPFVQLSTIITIQVNKSYDYSGKYAISEAVHKLESGAFTSTYRAIRGSFQPVSGALPTLNTDSSVASGAFGGSSQAVGTSPRTGQTLALTTTDSAQTVTIPVQDV